MVRGVAAGLLASENAGEKTYRAACVCGRGTAGLVASAPLAGRDGGFDLGDVLAAASPRGLTAILASNWTAHDVFLSAGGVTGLGCLPPRIIPPRVSIGDYTHGGIRAQSCD